MSLERKRREGAKTGKTLGGVQNPQLTSVSAGHHRETALQWETQFSMETGTTDWPVGGPQSTVMASSIDDFRTPLGSGPLWRGSCLSKVWDDPFLPPATESCSTGLEVNL